MQKTPYAIIGDGRCARHFCHYLRLSKIPFQQWSRQQGEDLQQSVSLCQTIFLLISDDAIAPFIDENQWLKEKDLYHFSGALLNKDAQSIHPLINFSGELFPLSTYQQIPFVHEKGGISLNQLIPELPNPTAPLAKNKRALYHALAVLCGNGSTLLWQKAMADFSQKLGLPTKLLLPYLRQTCKSLEDNWQNALTGPWVRDDQVTIKKNIESLNDDIYQEVYKSLQKAQGGIL